MFEGVEDEHHALVLFFDNIAQPGVFHNVHVLVRIGSAHIFAGYFAYFLPLIVCDIETCNLVVRVIARGKHSLAQVEERSVGVDFYFP